MESEPEGDREKGRGAALQPGACIVIKRGPEDKGKETKTAVASQDESVDLLSSDDEQQNVVAPEQVMRSSVSEVNNTPKDPIANSGKVPTGVQKCRGCFEVFPDQIKMMYHIAICEKVQKGDVSNSSSEKLRALSKVVVYPCSTCPKKFITEETLQKHQQTQHARCQYCQQIFKTSTELVFHKNEMHKHICRICGDVYHAKEPAKRHCGVPQGEIEAEAAIPDKNVEGKEEIVKPTLQYTTSGLLVASNAPEAPSDNANKTTSTNVDSRNLYQLLESGTFDPFAYTQRMDVLEKACSLLKKCVFCSIPYKNTSNCRMHVSYCSALAVYTKENQKSRALPPPLASVQPKPYDTFAAPLLSIIDPPAGTHQQASKRLPQLTKSNNSESDKVLNFNFVDIPCIPLEPKCECLICGASTASAESLLTHMELHKNVDPLADVIKEEDCSTQPGDQEEEHQSLLQSVKHAVTQSQILAVTPSQIHAVTPSQILAVTQSQIHAVTPSQIHAVTPSQILAVTPSQIHAVTPSQILAVTPSQIHAVTPSQIHAVTPSQILAVTQSQIHAVTPSKIHAVAPSQIYAVTPSQIQAVTPSQIHAVTPSQIHAVTQSQIHAVTQSKEQKDVVKPTEKDICLQPSSITSEISKLAGVKVRIPNTPVIGTRFRNLKCLICFSKFADWISLYRHCWKIHGVKLKRIGVPLHGGNEIPQISRTFPIPSGKNKCFLCNLNCLNWDTLTSHYINAHDIKIVASHSAWSQKRISALLKKQRNATRVKVGPIIDNFFNQTIQMQAVDSIPNKESIRCLLCSRNYKRQHYKTHLLHMHSARALFLKPKPYVCAYCKTTFESVEEMKNHLNTKHSNYIICKYCTVPIRGTKIQRAAHMKKVHPTILDCSLCDLLFQTKEEQAQHLTWHSKEEEIKCERCDKMLIGQLKYKWHMLHHDDENATLCSICGFKCATKLALTLHNFRIHQISGDALCVECGITVPSIMYGWHRRQKHVAKLPGMCDMCPRVYREKRFLNRHKLECHSGNEHPCKTCNLTFSTGAELAQHRREVFHEPAPPKKLYTCQDCGQEMTSTWNFRVHRRYQHEKHLFVSCTVCPMKFPFAQNLEKHMLMHRDNTAEHVCSFCTQPCDSAESLQQHLQNMHQGEGSFTCSFCQEVFHRQESLIIHERIHTNEKPHACKVCSKTFQDIVACKQHEARKHKMHSSLQATVHKYTCQECGKRSSSLCRLHVQQRTQPQKDLVLSCPACSMKFPSAKARDRHMLKRHGAEAQFKCSICRMSFISEYSWGTHIQTVHRTERPFSCQYCPDKFKSKFAATLHERTHTGEKPYACKVCFKTFGQISARKRHEVNVHKLHSAASGSTSSPEYMVIEEPGIEEPLPLLDQSPPEGNRAAAFIATLRERTHTGEKPYACKVCFKTFGQKSTRKRHEVKVHKLHSAASGSTFSPEYMVIEEPGIDEPLPLLDQSPREGNRAAAFIKHTYTRR